MQEKIDIIMALASIDDAIYSDPQVFLHEQGVAIESNDLYDLKCQFIRYLQDHQKFPLGIKTAKLHISQRKNYCSRIHRP